jgi:hypothetical protein
MSASCVLMNRFQGLVIVGNVEPDTLMFPLKLIKLQEEIYSTIINFDEQTDRD